MDSNKLSKADKVSRIINKFGGVRSTARIIKRSPGAVCHWKKRRHIPLKAIKDLMVAAKKLNIKIKVEDLVI